MWDLIELIKFAYMQAHQKQACTFLPDIVASDAQRVRRSFLDVVQWNVRS
jgi:hypothetical protein